MTTTTGVPAGGVDALALAERERRPRRTRGASATHAATLRHRHEIVVRIVVRRLGARVRESPAKAPGARRAPDDRAASRRRQRPAVGGGAVAEPGPTGTSATNSSTSMIATPDRTRGAGFRTMHHRLPSVARVARAPRRRGRSARAMESSRIPTAWFVADRMRSSIARATSSIEQPQSVSCGCAASSVRHACSTSGRRDGPRRDASALHGSASRMSARSAIGVHPLLVRARRERALKRPRVAVRIAQLTANDRQRADALARSTSALGERAE